MNLNYENIALSSKPFTSKDHQECSSYSFMNNANYLKWRHKNYNRLSDSDFYSPNRHLLLENFGQQNFCIIADYVIWHCWAIEYKNYTFLIFSSKEGTRYEIVYTGTWTEFTYDIELGKIIIEFNLWLIKNIFN